ncbi:uncharacterized protein PV06_03874 [Exophiala oligosperma]|uniref:Cell pattern formation-associated protein stuA n=1 Tax=Exophiala oligosperma TaxID=215243 RepID=A0A0D2C6V8_9EURO|nr:uncharacterized protein PV06_03874 [Exophiala oligosperma]KIW45487.1 hypothetical protein PV06_03874 [Exophiala oligosperma]
MPPFHAFQYEWSDDDSDVNIEDFKQVPKSQKWTHQRDISTDVKVVGDDFDSRPSTTHHSPQHRVRRGHERERSLPSNPAINLSDDASREPSPEGHAVEIENDRKWQQNCRGVTNKDEWLELSESDRNATQQIYENESIELPPPGGTTLVQESQALTRGSSLVVEQAQDAVVSSPSPTDQSPQRSSPPTHTSQSPQRSTKLRHAISQSARARDPRDTTGSSRPARKHQAKERKNESSDMVESGGSVSHVYPTERSGVFVYEVNINGILVMRNQSDSWVNASSMLRAIGVKDGQMRRKIVMNAGGPQRITNGGHWFYQGRWVPLATARGLATKYDVKDVLAPLLDLLEAQPPSSREARQPNSERAVTVPQKSMTTESDNGELKNDTYKNAQNYGRLAT